MADIFTLSNEIGEATPVTDTTPLAGGQTVIVSDEATASPDRPGHGIYGLKGTVARTDGDTVHVNLPDRPHLPEVPLSRAQIRIPRPRRQGFLGRLTGR